MWKSTICAPLIIAFVAIVLVGSAACAKAPPPGTNASTGTADIYFAIDTSGSMQSAPSGYNVGARGEAQGCNSRYTYYGPSSSRYHYYYYRYRNPNTGRYYRYRQYNYNNNNGGYQYNSNMGFVTRSLKDIVTEPDLASNAHFGLITWSSSSRNVIIPSSSGGTTINRMVEQCDPSFRPTGGTRPDNPLRDAYYYFVRQGSSTNTCNGRQRAVILLSDGIWSPSYQSSAINWANRLRGIGVSTFVVGFTNLSGNSLYRRNYTDLAAAGGTTPIVTTSIQLITSEIKRYIRSIVQSNLSFTSPVILPSISGRDRIFQPDFVFSQSGQWRGSLRGYELLPNGFINQSRGELFDAGERLNNVRAGSRRIWTVMPGMGYSKTGGVGNFTTANSSQIHSQTLQASGFSSTYHTQRMIDFIRGVDVFSDKDIPNSSHNERWKLGDIYNSTPILVGPPSATIENSSVSNIRDVSSAAEYRGLARYDQFRVSSVCGTRCVFRRSVLYAGANDGLLHAFDNSGNELWAFMPYAFRHNWGTNNPAWASSRRSTAVYGVDGQIIAQDVYVGGRWRTYLAFGMGRGGRAFYVLDVTNPSHPTLVYGVENNLSNNEVIALRGDGSVQRWISNQPRSSISDYEFLGYTTASPRIELKYVSGLPRWILSIPAGYDASPATPLGKAYFELDLDTLELLGGGAVVASEEAGDGIANSLISDADLINKRVFNANTPRVDYATVIAEREGVLSIFDGGTYSQLVDLTASSSLDRQLFFPTRTGYDRRGVMNIFGATGDYFNIQSRNLSNRNVVFGVDLSANRLNALSTGANGNPLLRPVATSYLSSMQSANRSSACVAGNDWSYDLRSFEKASGAVALTSATVFVPAYTPAANCIGTSRLLELDLTCGTVLNSYSLGQGLVTSPIVYQNRIYAGISSRTTPQGGGQYQNAVREGNLIVIEPAQSISNDGELTFESWIEY